MRTRAAALAALATVAMVAAAGCFGAANQPPAVTSRVSPQLVAVGNEVVFTGTAVDPDGSVVSFSWEFGDGTPAFTNHTRGSTVHKYAHPGNFTAVFTACDDKGACPSEAHNLTVIATFTISADWAAGQNGYVIKGPASLDAALVRVTISADGFAPLDNASVGAGLTVEGNTTYRGHLGPETIVRYHATQVHVYYNGSLAANRTVLATPFQGSGQEAVLRYAVGISEQRPLPGVNSSLDYEGNETWLTVGLSVSHQFDGTGQSSVRTETAGTVSWANSTFSAVSWDEQWSRADGAITPTDFSWRGNGTLDAVGPTGFRVFLNLTDINGSEASGNLTALRSDGLGYYVGEVGGTTGNATYSQRSVGSLSAQDGNGAARDALRVEENSTLNGTYGGVAFYNENHSARLTVRGDGFLRPDFWSAWNTSSTLGNSTTTDTGSRYLDSNGDGLPDPVAMPTLASRARNFEGLVPSLLQVGDQFAVASGPDSAVAMTVLSINTDILIATGLPTVGIPVASVVGSFGDPNSTAVLSGALSLNLVADGPYAGMWISGSTRLYLDEQSYYRGFELRSKA